MATPEAVPQNLSRPFLRLDPFPAAATKPQSEVRECLPVRDSVLSADLARASPARRTHLAFALPRPRCSHEDCRVAWW